MPSIARSNVRQLTRITPECSERMRRHAVSDRACSALIMVYFRVSDDDEPGVIFPALSLLRSPRSSGAYYDVCLCVAKPESAQQAVDAEIR
jgi:hypothetical protein